MIGLIEMKISKKSQAVLDFFNKVFPNVGCELNYDTDYGLLISVVLSAQTTDKAVNKVTPILFQRFPTLESLANADVNQIGECIRQIGLYHAKAKNIKQISIDLITRFDSKVPNNKKDLMSMPGVGNKTANVILCELFHQNEFPVDTHIFRIAKRLNYTNESDDVIVTEEKLRKAFPKDTYILLHHQLIHFGRYICQSRKPNCEKCELHTYCKYYMQISKKKI